jgi:dTDP-4-amino-4,6-dideoxygalactose transaminase
LCDELQGVAGIRAPKTLPGAVRGGYQAFVLVYEGEELGGPSREEFVRAVRKEGAPLLADRYSQINYTYGMLHKAPLFTELHRPSLGGGCYDPTRPWEETVQTVSLPVSERLAEQLVSFPRLDTASQRYVRGCGRAIKKVLQGLGVTGKTQARTALRGEVAMAGSPSEQEQGVKTSQPTG